MATLSFAHCRHELWRFLAPPPSRAGPGGNDVDIEGRNHTHHRAFRAWIPSVVPKMALVLNLGKECQGNERNSCQLWGPTNFPPQNTERNMEHGNPTLKFCPNLGAPNSASAICVAIAATSSNSCGMAESCLMLLSRLLATRGIFGDAMPHMHWQQCHKNLKRTPAYCWSFTYMTQGYHCLLCSFPAPGSAKVTIVWSKTCNNALPASANCHLFHSLARTATEERGSRIVCLHMSCKHQRSYWQISYQFPFLVA